MKRDQAVFLPVLRELARCYQAFESFSANHVRLSGLTPSQFDVVATLGNTPGMTFRELGEKTLITKGTLTGVVDRLEAKGLVLREGMPSDGRCMLVRLTPQGERVFADAFPAQLAVIGQAMAAYTQEELDDLQAALKRLGGMFPPQVSQNKLPRN